MSSDKILDRPYTVYKKMRGLVIMSLGVGVDGLNKKESMIAIENAVKKDFPECKILEIYLEGEE